MNMSLPKHWYIFIIPGMIYLLAFYILFGTTLFTTTPVPEIKIIHRHFKRL